MVFAFRSMNTHVGFVYVVGEPTQFLFLGWERVQIVKGLCILYCADKKGEKVSTTPCVSHACVVVTFARRRTVA